MNFLAHLYLSDDDPHTRIGNFLADFVKGPAFNALPPSIQVGVRQHRLVDGFTDRHPMVQRSIGRISKDWGWFSGIIIDVYYDHLLARSWTDFSPEPLRDFADRMYATVRGGTSYFDAEGSGFLDWFIAQDRLVMYAAEEGIRDTLKKLSKRIAARIPNRALPLDEAMPLLREVDAQLDADFRAFFPEVRAFASGAGGSANRR